MPGKIWDDLITEHDRQVYDKAGYGQHGGFAERPAVLVVDVTYDFTGDRDEPILDSIDKFRNSCGQAAWASLPHIRDLITAARAKGIPVIYTHASPRPDLVRTGGWARKNSRAMAPTEISARIGNYLPDIIAPQPSDVVMQKGKPSAFLPTPLVAY